MIKPILDAQIEPYLLTPRKGRYAMQLTYPSNICEATNLTIAEIFALKKIECNSK